MWKLSPWISFRSQMILVVAFYNCFMTDDPACFVEATKILLVKASRTLFLYCTRMPPEAGLSSIWLGLHGQDWAVHPPNRERFHYTQYTIHLNCRLPCNSSRNLPGHRA